MAPRRQLLFPMVAFIRMRPRTLWYDLILGM